MPRARLSVSILLVLAALPAVGQEVGHLRASDATLEFADESQLAAQEASVRFLGNEQGNVEGKSGYNACRDWWTCPNPGLNVAFEMMWFRPHATDPLTSGLGNRWSDASRLTIGYLNDSGEEIRVRLFEWATDAGTTTNQATDLWYFDTEYAGRFNLGHNWDGELSLGARFAEFREEEGTSYNNSLGPVIGMHLKSRPILGQARLVGSARYAHQFGKGIRNEGLFDVERASSFSISELQVGLELSHETGFGHIDVRPFFEAQNWAGDYDGSDEDFGLIGMGMLLQVSR